VTKPASSEATNATALAMSCGVQARPSRLLIARPGFSCAWPTGDPTLFGLTVLTRIP